MRPTSRSSDATLVGALLTFAGAVALCLSAQLDIDEPRGLVAGPLNGGAGDVASASRPEFSHHGGSIVLGFGALIIVTIAWVLLRRPKQPWWLVVFCAMASGCVALLEFNSTLRTVYPVGPDGLPDRTAVPIVLSLGTAGITAVVGAAAALVGSVLLVRGASAAQRT